ncbi:ribosomal protein S18-alanine N-acetyltransferase [Pullulanibacillus sp. KACC 23026]|uniref:ribosomal protein S18-alanine N-acetyltransferase n=1 Tax=Pullulanibacillus sp. KACC 23026 TaxID=3028315 RepID=UPI0023AFCC66|nr:ribosomal protein S18-alanine N-acetyltransferase [Pullulanibacillus sp. KACC 23026]WEG12512.1 ribosomal protein S18-alanine N-acetyltransferase [Pullulanibacillus sp. KACC 23026]
MASQSKEDFELSGDVELRVMTLEDVDGVHKIETACFATPWSRSAFVNEVLHNQFATYFVAEEAGQLLGYIGCWVVIDDANITNIAVLPDYRGRKIGEALLRTAMELARLKQATRMSLEVRVSNTVAQNLYEKLGFQRGGIRKNYYTDNNEDAYVMWVTL